MTGGRNWFVWRVLVTVVLIGLLVAGGFAIHRLGWSQGYTAAELASQGEESPLPPLVPAGWRPVGFTGGRLLITLLLGLLFLTLVGKLLGVILWGAMAGLATHGSHLGGPWRDRRHWMHGPVPPWYCPGHERPGEPSQEPGDRASAET